MLSPRRSAQLGLSAASLALVTSITILIAGSSDPSKAPANISSVVPAGQVAPLANSPIASIQSDDHVSLASDKR